MKRRVVSFVTVVGRGWIVVSACREFLANSHAFSDAGYLRRKSCILNPTCDSLVNIQGKSRMQSFCMY